MNAIEIKGVTKRYGDVTALDNVSLTLEANKIYGLLGRNGAGKTTLLNAITNRIFPDEGTIAIDGAPVLENDAALDKVYMMSEQATHPDGMRVQDAFRWTAALHDASFDMDRAKRLCDAFGLNPRKKVKELSTGYGSIFKLVTALSLQTPYVLLDEPVLGLDANHRDLLYRLMLEQYAEQPRTIVVSTHLIEEVASLIEEVVIIKRGQIIRQMPVETLLSEGYTIAGPAAAVDAYLASRQALGVDTLGGLKTAYLLGTPDRDALPAGLELGRMDLQRLFIQLTNE